MSQEPSWEQLLDQVIDAAGRAGQPGLLGGGGPAREERLLAALPAIIAELRRQGLAEEALFPAVVAALQRELSGQG